VGYDICGDARNWLQFASFAVGMAAAGLLVFVVLQLG
jgi:hypothetical protein